MHRHVLIVLILVQLSACATLTGGHEQDISITTTPAGATCTLTNGQASWTLAQTPASVSVERALQPLSITCKLAGYKPAHMPVEAKTRGRAYGNILLLGIPTLVDAATGAGYAYEPEDVALTLTPATSSSP